MCVFCAGIGRINAAFIDQQIVYAHWRCFIQPLPDASRARVENVAVDFVGASRAYPSTSKGVLSLNVLWRTVRHFPARARDLHVGARRIDHDVVCSMSPDTNDAEPSDDCVQSPPVSTPLIRSRRMVQSDTGTACGDPQQYGAAAIANDLQILGVAM